LRSPADLVDAVVPKDQLIPTAEKFAERISPEMSALARHLDQETAESENGAEGPRAFKERRKPQRKLRRAGAPRGAPGRLVVAGGPSLFACRED
jgi:enoyl-CoA hydratase/carnithine racemase